MSTSVEFKGTGFSETLSETYQTSIAHDTKQTYTQDISYDVELTCTAKGSGGVGLWQYVQESADGKTQVLSMHTVCRYGDLYNKSPRCPWNACTNADCSECATDWTA